MTEKFPKNKNVSRKILIIIIMALVALPLLLFDTVTNGIVEKITQTISLQYSQEQNAQMSSHISSTIDFYFHELNAEFNALKSIEDLDETKLKRYIASTEQANHTSYLAFADRDGYVYEADGSYLGTMRIEVLGELLSGTERIISDNVTIGNNSYILIGTFFEEAISLNGKEICIGLLGMTTDDLTENLVLKSEYSGGYSSVIHKDGSFVVKNSAEANSGLNMFSILGKNFPITEDELEILKETVRNGETYFYNALSNGNESSEYLYFAPVSNTEWYIVNTLPTSFIKDSVISLRNTIEKVYLLFVLLSLLVAAFIIAQQFSATRKLKKSHKELDKALKIAKEASNAKTDFLFSMSHDIRTPMNAILGYTDIGLKHVSDAEVSRDSYRKIKLAGGHLLNLINDILEMSRIDSGKMGLNEKPLDIRNSIAGITTMSQSLAIEKSIDYETVIGEIRNPYIYADELHINEVLINIISNAVKYTPVGGKVRYRIEQTEEMKDGKSVFRFEISDNGIGMSEEFQQHLFETFSREENTTISKIEGTGLGLSIVKRIVDMSGGEIKVHSVQGQGSTFTVEIPFRLLTEEEIETFTAEKAKTETLSAPVSLAGKKVLLAEDNELNREIAVNILESVGLEVDTAEDGNEAVNTIMEKGVRHYDFILMDIQMPVMNGYEATQKIRQFPDGDSIPIIALSANAFEEDKQKSKEEGMDAHVAKPIDTRILLETMQEFLR